MAQLVHEVSELREEVAAERKRAEALSKSPEDAVRSLAESVPVEQATTEPAMDGVVGRIVAPLVDLGIPGLVLLAVTWASGFAGAAAITSGLASLGGPLA
ncbi:MAG TPA: hypothetical protein VFP94_07270 [Terriglobales bacterium]|nr:hypothetical protein [Terriglobales bacterium]